MKLSADGYLINDLGKEMTCGNYPQMCGVHCVMFELIAFSNSVTNITLWCNQCRIIPGVDGSQYMEAREKSMTKALMGKTEGEEH